MIPTLRAWLTRRRRARLEREERELADLLRRASRFRDHPFIRSVLSQNARRGYVTPKQHRALQRVVRLQESISHGA